MKVLKPFKTAIQRFSKNDPVDPTADFTPHTLESLKAGKFIGAGVEEPATPAAPAVASGNEDQAERGAGRSNFPAR